MKEFVITFLAAMLLSSLFNGLSFAEPNPAPNAANTAGVPANSEGEASDDTQRLDTTTLNAPASKGVGRLPGSTAHSPGGS